MTSSSSEPLIVCYDGSPHAKQAVEYAGRMFPGGFALVLTVWQPTAGLGSLAWSGAIDRMDDFAALDRSAADNAGRVAEEGAELARRAGLDAQPLAAETAGPIWKEVVDLADQHDAAMIIVGSRGHSTLASILLGSVSNAVVHHATRATLVVHGQDPEPAPS